MSSSAAGLYAEDFVRWAEQQSAALREAARAGTNLPLDWDNLAEEVESLGRSTRRELRSRIGLVIEHLIKLDCSPAGEPRRGWIDSVGRERGNIEDLLNDSPSLRSEVAGIIEREAPRMKRLVSRGLIDYGETTPDSIAKLAAASYTEDQVLGDWFPGDAPHRDPLPAGGEREQPEK